MAQEIDKGRSGGAREAQGRQAQREQVQRGRNSLGQSPRPGDFDSWIFRRHSLRAVGGGAVTADGEPGPANALRQTARLTARPAHGSIDLRSESTTGPLVAGRRFKAEP